jgi:tRNA dimethylallyltransferase
MPELLTVHPALDALVLAGATATGKTALALALSEQLPIEIINMDSALVYRQLDIATAKPTRAEQDKVVHHLIDIRDVTEAYSAADFARDAERLVSEIKARGKLPVVVGGTMLYLMAWLEGLSDLPSADPVLRAELQYQWQHSPEALYQRLQEQDPETAQRLHPNDPQRVMRALEVIALTGQPLSVLQKQRRPTAHRVGVVLLQPPSRAWLHERIHRRFSLMLEAGALEEARALAEAEFDMSLPALRSVGYRQMLYYLNGVLSYDEMVEQATMATRHLAKRQQTWMKKIQPLLEIEASLPLADQLALLSNVVH